jgi:hypothetical protein
MFLWLCLIGGCIVRLRKNLIEAGIAFCFERAGLQPLSRNCFCFERAGLLAAKQELLFVLKGRGF